MKYVRFLLPLILAVLLASGCASNPVQPGAEASSAPEEVGPLVGDSEEPGSQVAGADQMAPVEEVVEDGMVPICGSALKDGVYSVVVDSSSSMFSVTGCELTVADGKMSAVMHMGGKGYLKVFMGTGEEAAAAGDDAGIPFSEAEDGTHTFTVPVEALDTGIPCAAFSKKKELWYDRTLVFRGDSLPADAFRDGTFTGAETLEDGAYTVEVRLEGGSGRASVESPAALRVEDGTAYASVVWGSSNYSSMRIGEETFAPVNTSGNSAFEIPVSVFDRKLAVYAETTAMSTPHEIEYTLYFDASTIKNAE